jgi:FkbM family methyltransferase
MNSKAVARYFYANIPGVAAVRFAVKDLAAPHFFKPEFRGIAQLPIGNGLIVDIGANRGQSIAAFKKLAPNSQIIAFEPEPRSAERLVFHYRGDTTVTVHACALGSSAGEIDFFLPKYGRWDCDGMAATSLKEATEWLKNPGRMYRFDEKKLTVREYRVSCNVFDSYGLAPLLIKVHAQGAELDILKGSQQTLNQQRPALMCAFPPPAVTNFLAGFGYRPHVYSDGHFKPGIAPPPFTFTWYLTDAHRVAASKPRTR